ncbi:MAG: hypothetical protein O2931_05190, partial [Planctomycetota bacterium]|nr:hypothetical protein [Planctomycetota bacterium]
MLHQANVETRIVPLEEQPAFDSLLHDGVTIFRHNFRCARALQIPSLGQILNCHPRNDIQLEKIHTNGQVTCTGIDSPPPSNVRSIHPWIARVQQGTLRVQVDRLL